MLPLLLSRSLRLRIIEAQCITDLGSVCCDGIWISQDQSSKAIKAQAIWQLLAMIGCCILHSCPKHSWHKFQCIACGKVIQISQLHFLILTKDPEAVHVQQSIQGHCPSFHLHFSSQCVHVILWMKQGPAPQERNARPARVLILCHRAFSDHTCVLQGDAVGSNFIHCCSLLKGGDHCIKNSPLCHL